MFNSLVNMVTGAVTPSEGVETRTTGTAAAVVETGVVEKDQKEVSRVVETDRVERNVVGVKGAEVVQDNIQAQHKDIKVGKTGQAAEQVGLVTETDITQREVKMVDGQAHAVAGNTKSTGVEVGTVTAMDVPVARVVEKETTERAVRPTGGVTTHASNAKDTSIATGVMDAKAREVGEVVETATVVRSVVPTKGAKIDLPLDGAEVSTSAGTATLNIGVVGRAQQVVGEVVETETVSRAMEKVNDAGHAIGVAPKVETIKTGVVGRTAQQVAEVHETQTLDRNLEHKEGAAKNIDIGGATVATVATGTIDAATKPVAEVVETKTQEREVQAVENPKAVVGPAATHVEKVETGAVAVSAKEVGEVVETHTKTRQVNN